MGQPKQQYTPKIALKFCAKLRKTTFQYDDGTSDVNYSFEGMLVEDGLSTPLSRFFKKLLETTEIIKRKFANLKEFELIISPVTTWDGRWLYREYDSVKFLLLYNASLV